MEDCCPSIVDQPYVVPDYLEFICTQMNDLRKEIVHDYCLVDCHDVPVYRLVRVKRLAGYDSSDQYGLILGSHTQTHCISLNVGVIL